MRFMKPQLHSQISPKSSAFSLVEVVLALGICSFAMIGIVGMIPVGLSTFKGAMETTAQAQIVQALASEVLLTDYQTLTGSTGRTAPSFYNEQGMPTEEHAADCVYTAFVEQQLLATPADLSDNTRNDLSDDPAFTLLIHVSNKSNPRQVYTFPLIIANSDQS
jgi:uncharacterized protein (TIGR02598 family)